MTDSLLCGLFALHFIAFALLWRRRKAKRYIRLMLLFSLLVAIYGMRLAGYAHAQWQGLPVEDWVRGGAYILGGISILDALRRRTRRVAEP